jgi:ADP-ribose pyrophosphatase YjhB (NUDIX family)
MVVGCIPVFEHKILLCRRAIEPQYGLWNLPAGYLENGETVAEGALRETWEEANIKVELVRLHSIYNLLHVQQVYLFFLANMSSPYYGCGDETLEAQLFEETNLPWNELAFSSNAFALRKYLADKTYPGVHMGSTER